MVDLFADTTEAAHRRLAALTPGNALELGKAAEHLVCADLLLQGYRVFLSDQGMPYDVVVDTGRGLVRVQVKSTCFEKLDKGRKVYIFKTNNKGRFKAGAYDVLALVALDIRMVAYFPVAGARYSVRLRAPDDQRVARRGRRPLGCIDCYPFASALAVG